MKTTRVAVTVALLALLAAAPAKAADPQAMLPKAKSVNGIVYLTGGVGARERAALKPLAKDYNLRLTFVSEASGAYLAWVRVRIEDMQGRIVLEAISDGPWFFVRLPRERYRVMAALNDVVRSEEVDLGARTSAEVLMAWPATSN